MVSQMLKLLSRLEVRDPPPPGQCRTRLRMIYLSQLFIFCLPGLIREPCTMIFVKELWDNITHGSAGGILGLNVQGKEIGAQPEAGKRQREGGISH